MITATKTSISNDINPELLSVNFNPHFYDGVTDKKHIKQKMVKFLW